MVMSSSLQWYDFVSILLKANMVIVILTKNKSMDKKKKKLFLSLPKGISSSRSYGKNSSVEQNRSKQVWGKKLSRKDWCPGHEERRCTNLGSVSNCWEIEGSGWGDSWKKKKAELRGYVKGGVEGWKENKAINEKRLREEKRRQEGKVKLNNTKHRKVPSSLFSISC